MKSIMKKQELALLVAEQSAVVINRLRSVGPVAADKEVELFADKHGDKNTLELIKALPPLVVADLVKEFDSTKMGMAGSLLTPELLVNVVERLPLLGADVRRLRDTLCAVILQHEKTATRMKYFDALAKSKIGFLALVAAVAAGRCEDFFHFAKSGNFNEDDDDQSAETYASIPHGGWEELCFVLKTSSKNVFPRLLEDLRGGFKTRPSRNLFEEYAMEAKMAFSSDIVDDPYVVMS
jgi:hypothetical protein